MPFTAAGSAPGEPNAQEEYEEVYIYEAQSEEISKPATQKNKKKSDASQNEQQMQRMLKFVMSGRRPKKPEVTPIYEYDEDRKNEVFFIAQGEHSENERVYEVKRAERVKPPLVHSKGKDTYKKTPITGQEAQKEGSYSNRNKDYPIDEAPYGEVLLEEIVTEGKLRPDLQLAGKGPKENKGQTALDGARSDPQKDRTANAGQTQGADAAKKDRKKQETVIEEIPWDD